MRDPATKGPGAPPCGPTRPYPSVGARGGVSIEINDDEVRATRSPAALGMRASARTPLLIVERTEIDWHIHLTGGMAVLGQQGGDLAAMLRAVVHLMQEHLPDRVRHRHVLTVAV